jgi:hypothetical protein
MAMTGRILITAIGDLFEVCRTTFTGLVRYIRGTGLKGYAFEVGEWAAWQTTPTWARS